MPIQFITKQILGKLHSKKPQEISPWASFVHNYMKKKAGESYDHIRPFIKKSDKILDVGLGSGSLASFLKNKKFKVSGVDVINLSIYKDIQPKIYNGKKLPYKTNEFDVALLISVLHHCGKGKQNLEVLTETMRVAKRVIIIEDSYRNEFERQVVSLWDQLANWEFWRHPYLTNKQWFSFINKKKWRTVFAKEYSQLAFGMIYTHYCMYVLEKNS